MVEELRVYRGMNNRDCFYIACRCRLGLFCYSIGLGWQLCKFSPVDSSVEEDFPDSYIVPSSPLEMLVVSGLGIEQILQQGETMKVGQIVWIK
jgi:hypothetical protein